VARVRRARREEDAEAWTEVATAVASDVRGLSTTMSKPTTSSTEKDDRKDEGDETLLSSFR
jgi:hypothetical protein